MKRRIIISAFLIPAVFATVFLSSYSISNATSGCCSWHGGVAYCDTSVGTYVCNDGSYSPSCGCTYIPPRPVCVKPTVGNNATWNFEEDVCNQDVTISWKKGSLDEFYSIQISKTPGANPGPLSDTSATSFTFKNIKPGKWYVNIKPGRSCGWGDVYYWTVDVPDVVPSVDYFNEKVVSEDERQLQYSVSCVNKIEITPEVGVLKDTTGSITVHPKQTSFYTLTATNKNQKNYANLTIQYPLPKTDNENNLPAQSPSENSSRDGAGTSESDLPMMLILLVVVIGLVWILNKAATNRK